MQITALRPWAIAMAIYIGAFPAIAVLSYMVAGRRMPTWEEIWIASFMGYALLFLPAIIAALADLLLSEYHMFFRLLNVTAVAVAASLAASVFLFNGLAAGITGLLVFSAVAGLCCCLMAKSHVEASR